MKRIRCPKCDEAILFDDSLYTPGRTLVFECPDCHKQFKIRVGVKKPRTAPDGMLSAAEEREEEEEKPVLGYLVVIENTFHLRQEILLHEGENVIGRHVRGTNINCPIKTVDPSVDTTHCRITVKVNKSGRKQFILRDGPSGTGTFLMNEILGDRDRVNIEDGAIITIGATTMILHEGTPEDEQED